MTLTEYLARPRPRVSTTGLAERLGVDPAQVRQWRGGRPISAAMCVRIEVATRYAVRRWDLRPGDWFLIWPELRNRKGAPPIPACALAAA